MNMNMTILTKFFANITFFAINLQAMEVFPTCLRQTGMSTVAVVSSIFGTLGPMIVYLVSNELNLIFQLILMTLILLFDGSFLNLNLNKGSSG